jgi:hypothetical protein
MSHATLINQAGSTVQCPDASGEVMNVRITLLSHVMTCSLVGYRFLERTFCPYLPRNNVRQEKKLLGLSLRANYTDRAAAACRRP